MEIPAENMPRAVDFYNGLMNLEMEIMDFGEEKMALLPDDEGAISQAPGFKPSANGVLVSLDVGDRLDDALDFVVKNGGSVVKARTKIQAEGRDYFALFLDSEGNRMGLYGK